MAINIAYTATGTYPSNIAIRTGIPMITVHGTGGENVTNRIQPIANVISSASGVPTAVGTAPGVFVNGRDIIFDRIALRITGNAFVDFSGYNVVFRVSTAAGGLTLHGFNNTAPTTTQGDGNGQAGIITNQCNLIWHNIGTGGIGFDVGPFYAWSRWEAEDFNLLLDSNVDTVSAGWTAPGRAFTLNADGSPAGGTGNDNSRNNRQNANDQPLWTLNRGIITDGSGYSWGPQSATTESLVLEPTSALNNLTINTAGIQFTAGEFPGFTSTAAIDGFNRAPVTNIDPQFGRVTPIYPGVNIINGNSQQTYPAGRTATSAAGAFSSVSRDTPYEFRNYDFGGNWSAADADRIFIRYDGSRGPQHGVWYRWLYDWNVNFQEGNGSSTRVNGAPFDVFITTAQLNTAAAITGQMQRITSGQLWAETTLNTSGQPAWTPANTLANPASITSAAGSQGNEPLAFAGTAQTNIPIIKYWTNGLPNGPNNSARGTIERVYQTTRYDALLAYYPFSTIVFDNQTFDPRVLTANRVDGQTYNNPIDDLTQTVSVFPGITEENRTTVGSYTELTSTSHIFDRAYYDKIESINAATTYATKTTANNADAVFELNNGDVVPSTLTRNIRLTAASSGTITLNGNTLEIGTGGNFALNHNLRCTGTIVVDSGVTVTFNGFSLIDGNAPNLMFTGATATTRVSIYDVTSGNPTDADVSNLLMYSVVGTANNTTINAATTSIAAYLTRTGLAWNTRTIRIISSSPQNNMFTLDVDLSTSTGESTAVIEAANSVYNASATVTGTQTPSVFNDTSTGSSGVKLLVTTALTSLGTDATNRALQNLRGSQAYNDVAAINNLTSDYIVGIGLSGTGVDLRYFKCTTIDLSQNFTAVSELNNLAGISQSGNGDVFSERVTATVTPTGGSPVTNRQILVANDDAPTGISSDAFGTGLNASNTAITTAITNDGSQTRSTVWAAKYS